MLRLVASLASLSLIAAAPPAVTSVAVSPDGQRIAFGTHGEARIYRASGEPVAVLKGQGGRVTALAYSPNGRLLAAASGSPGKTGAVRIYDATTFKPRATIDGHTDLIYTIAFSPDSATLATAGYDRLIHLWDLSRPQKPKLTLKDHSDTIYSLAFHPDGKLLASCSADRAVKIWDAGTGQRLHTLSESTDWLYAVRWSPDRKHLAAAGVDRSIRIWAVDQRDAKLVHAAFAHEKPVWRLAYSRDGKTLYSAGEDRVVKAWGAAKLVESKVFAAMPDSILDFTLLPGDQQFAVGRYDGVGAIFDAATGKEAARLLPAATAPPKPNKLAPAAATRGLTTRVAITGSNLGHVRKVTANKPGIAARILEAAANRIFLDVAVAPDAAIGAVQLVVENEAGKAAPLTLAIDRYPAIQETGGTESARAAQQVKLPATLAGSIDRAGDADFFQFEAKLGDEVGVHVLVGELGSKLDPVIIVADRDGQVLAEGSKSLAFRPAKSGMYSLGIRDREYRGGPNMGYRIHAGGIPVVASVFPLGVQRGKTTTVHLDGVNLGESRQTVQVPVPANAVPGTRIPLPLPKSGEPPLGTLSVVVGEYPSHIVEPAAGAEIPVPGTADGILLKPNSLQVVRFRAKKGERLIVETDARRLGSPIDPVIEILDAGGKPVPRAVLRSTARIFSTFRDHTSASPGIRLESWNEIGIDDYLYADGELMRVLALPKGPDDDCQFYQVSGRRRGYLGTTPNAHAQGCPLYKVEQHPPGRTFPPNGLPVFTIFYRNDDGGADYGKDSLIAFEAPADGEYQARISDARGGGSGRHAYRLTVRPPRPDFTLSASPTAPSVWKGGALPVTINVKRIDGFEGPIRVKFEGLAPGWIAPETTIDAGQLSTSVALFAEAGAPAPKAAFKIVASATIAGKDVRHEATSGMPSLRDPGDILITTRRQDVSIQPGRDTRLIVDIKRLGDFKGRVPIEVRGLPHGARVLNIGLNGILITERDTSREIVIHAEPWLKPMTRPIVVLAKSERKRTEHAAPPVMLHVAK